MDFTLITALIGVTVTLSGIILGWSARTKEAEREVRKKAEIHTALRTDMKYLKRRVNDIRLEQRTQA